MYCKLKSLDILCREFGDDLEQCRIALNWIPTSGGKNEDFGTLTNNE